MVAIDVPKSPFTIIITDCTNNGNTVIVTKKFLLYFDVYLWVIAINVPKINDTIEERKNLVEIKDILNDFVGNKVLYPNAYNDTNEVTRYFNFKF